MKDSRAARLADYDLRARTDPDSVHEAGSLGGYIAVNPTADDTELLGRLRLKPEACTKVDCYWKRGEDVYFLQVQTSVHTDRKPGLWARVSPGEPRYRNLVGVVRDRVVTRDELHRVMKSFVGSLDDDLQVGNTLVRVGDVQE